VPVVAEDVLQRTLEPFGVAGRDEPAVLPVDQAVPPCDRVRLGHDHGLSKCHRLEEHCRRAGIAVLAHGESDEPRLGEPASHVLEGDVCLELDVLGSRAQLTRMVSAGHDPEGGVRHAVRDPHEKLEVAVRVRADRHDVRRRRLAKRLERLRVDSEGDELDTGSGTEPHEPAPNFLRLVLAVGDHHGARSESGGVQTTDPLGAQLPKALWKPDCHVKERRTKPARALQEHQRDPDRVDGREDDVGLVRGTQ